MTKQEFIKNATKQLNILKQNGLNKMSFNIINDCIKELLQNGKVETIFKSALDFFKNCGCNLQKKENSIITIITL